MDPLLTLAVKQWENGNWLIAVVLLLWFAYQQYRGHNRKKEISDISSKYENEIEEIHTKLEAEKQARELLEKTVCRLELAEFERGKQIDEMIIDNLSRIPTAVTMINLDGLITHMNKSAKRLFGDVALPAPLNDLVDMSDVPPLQGLLTSAATAGRFSEEGITTKHDQWCIAYGERLLFQESYSVQVVWMAGNEECQKAFESGDSLSDIIYHAMVSYKGSRRRTLISAAT